MFAAPLPLPSKGQAMTKSKAFTYADPLVIARMYAINASEETLDPLRSFIARRNKLSRAVINMMILYIISVDSEKKRKGYLPNSEIYYRKVQEDWLEENLITPEAVLSYFKKAMEIAQNLKGTNGAFEDVSPVKPMREIPIDPELERELDSIYNNIK